MDATKVQEHFGNYRELQVQTPRERRITLWTTAVAVVLLVGWGVFRFRREGVDGALHVGVYVVVLALSSVLMGRARRRWGPQTRLEASGVRMMTGLTGGRRVLAWDEVTDVEATSRFTGHPVMVLRDGGRVELPGVPTAVAERLRAASASGESRAVTPPPGAAPAPSGPGDDAWCGPFRRG